MAVDRGARPRLLTPRRVVTSVLLSVAVAGLFVGFGLHDDSPSPRLRPAAVVAVSPEPGTHQLRQAEIFAELGPTYRGRLVVNGRPIPDDQLQVIGGLNRVSFTPGKDREIESLPPGRACVEVVYVLVTDPDQEPGRYRWCFNVS